MSTLHKVKAYFGMAPMDDYEDDYYIDDYEIWENAETTTTTSVLHQCWRT